MDIFGSPFAAPVSRAGTGSRGFTVRGGRLTAHVPEILIDGRPVPVGVPSRLVDGAFVDDATPGGHYVRDGALRPLGVGHRSALEKLFPRGVRNAVVHQGKYSNCTSLAVLLAVARNRPSALIEMIAPAGSGAISVGAPDARHRTTVRGAPSLERGISSESDLGMRILEYVLASTHVPRGGDPRFYLAKPRDGLEAFDFLFAKKAVIADFPRWSLENDTIHRRKMYAALDAIEREPTRAIAIVGFLTYPVGQAAALRLPGHHAYAIERVMSDARIVRIVNPHDSRRKIELSFRTFMQNVHHMTSLRV